MYAQYSGGPMKTSSLELVIGDKNLSSWSLRPWLVIKASGLPFKETKVLLDRPDTAKKLRRVSPSERVPVLHHKGMRIWDSLAICEYIHELAPEKNLWPRDTHMRAVGRSMVAEMHSGFMSLRGQLSMDITLRTKIKHLTPQTIADIDRILHIWTQSLKMTGGPYLFGEFSIADAFYTPVVFRLQSYGIETRNPIVRKYRETLLKNTYVKEWVKGAKSEKPYFTRF